MQVSNVSGSAIGDEITGNDGDDWLFGSRGGDSLDGSAGRDNIFGDAAHDLIQGGVGPDDLRGGDGDDVIYATDLSATAEEVGVNNGLRGEAGADTLIGALRKDFINGGAGLDALFGGGGNDEFYIYEDDLEPGELIDGGEGQDALLIDHRALIQDFRQVSVASIEALLLGFSASSMDSLRAIFHAAQINAFPTDLALVSGQQASTLEIAMGGEIAVTLSNLNLLSNWGAEGGDHVEVVGDVDSEVMVGTGSVDSLFGNGGNDRLDGGAGADQMKGGPGNEIYYVKDASDAVIELAGQGTDQVRTTLLTYTLGANLERLVFEGAGNFIGRGNILANLITGATGNDRFLLDAGGADTFNGGSGIDTVDYRASTVSVTVDLSTSNSSGAAAGDRYLD